MKRNKLYDIPGWVLLTIAVMLTGCYSLKTATKQVARAGIEYPELIAANCANKFPVVAKEGKPVIKYLPADNADYTGKIDSLSDALGWMRSMYEGAINAHKGDTSCQNTIRELQNRNDSLFRAFMDFKGKYIPCKPDTLRIFKTDTIPDLAAIAVRDGQISGLKVDNEGLSQKLKTSRKWNYYFGGFILLCGVGAFVKLRYFRS